MHEPGAVEITVAEAHAGLFEDARTFPCGHAFRLTSGSARRVWWASRECPRCSVSHGHVQVYVCRVERGSGRPGDYDWFPGVRVNVHTQQAQGFATAPERFAEVCARVEEIRERHGFRYEDQAFPGLGMDTREEREETRKKLTAFLSEVRALGVRLTVGGAHADRLGLRED